MGGLKKKGIVKQHTKQYYGIVTEPIPITQISDDLSEEQFLVAYRNLVTYDERKEQLLKRGYKLVDGEWVKNKKLSKEDKLQFYYTTTTINKLSKIETWVKRKPFTLIQKQLLSDPNISLNNPYIEFTVIDDKGNPQIFYRKK